MSGLPSKHRSLPALGVVGTALGSALTFAVALGAGVLLHLDLPAARQFATRELNRALLDKFKGRITLERVATLRVDRVGGLDARILAADGTTVVVARGVRARVHPIALVKSVLQSGALDVGVLDVDVEFLDVCLDADEAGTLKLQTAFESASATGGGRPLRLAMTDITVHRAFVHGQMKGVPRIDADLKELRGAVGVVPHAVAVDVSHAVLFARGMPEGANPRGTIEAHVAVPSKAGHTLGIDASFDGRVGGIPATARAVIEGDRLDAVLDVPEVADDLVRALVAQAPVHRPVAAHLEAHGDLASLHTTAHLTVGAAELRAEAELALVGKFPGTVGLDVRNVDLRALWPEAPSSRLALHADVRFDMERSGVLAGRFTATVPEGGEIGNQFIPAATLQGDFEQRLSSMGRGGLEVKMQGLVSEPGAPTDLRVGLRTDTPAPVLDFDASSHIARLADIRRVRGLGGGAARLRVQGTITLAATPSFDATLVGDVEGFQQATARAETSRLVAHGFGPFAKPTVDATLEADEVSLSRYQFPHARVTTQGPLSAERVTLSLRGERTPSLRASGTVDLFSEAPTLRDAQLDVSRGRQALHAAVNQVRVGSRGVDMVGAWITGIGEPIRASFDTRRGSLLVQASSKGVDLQALGYLLGMEDTLKQGRLAFVVDLTARRDGAEGSATVDLDHGRLASLDEVSGHIDTHMQGREVTGVVKASLGGLGTLDVSQMHTEVGGTGPLSADSWRRTWGTLRIDGQIDLAKVAELLPPNTLPFSRLSGRLTLQGQIKRDDEADVTPNVAFTLKTSGLRLAPRTAPDVKSGGTTLVATPPWDLSGIDVQLDVRADGDSGFAEIAARLVDKEGALVSMDAKSDALPYTRLFASNEGEAEYMKDVPFSALIVIPSRKLDRLPDIVKPDGASGDVEARIAIEGTVRKPTIDATVKAHAIKFDRSQLVRKLDADLAVKYNGSAGDVILDARSSKNGALHATAHVNAKVDDVLGAKTGDFPWDASGKATFTRFPLGAAAELSNRQVRGEMSGFIELTDLHKDARAKVDLDLASLRVGDETFQAGNVKVALDGHTLQASARIERTHAVASANAKVGMTWGTNMTPSVDPSGSADASFQATHFPASILAPLVQNLFDELQGTIDADAHVSLHPNEKPKMNGAITLNDGLVEVIALGQELHGVKAKMLFTPDGVVRLESLTASGTTGKLTASGAARLDGFNLVGADAVLTIGQGDAMPLDLQGAPMGTVYGQLDMKATSSSDQKAIDLKVDVASLHVELPEASTHSVQELDESKPQTHVGVYASPGKFVELPLDGFDIQEQTQAALPPSNTLTVDLHLGRSVEIQRGTDLKVDLEGDLTAKVGQKIEVTGQIRLKSGTLDVRGKAFEIETGTLTFAGDSSNPEVQVTAVWTAGDGTRVYADYVGPLKTGKVILRSQPARPQNEILELVLFGTADGAQGTPYLPTDQPNGATQAGTAVGGLATAGLSKGLNKLTGIAITTKIDTSRANNPRPEVAVQIARDISLQLAVVLGPTLSGTNADTTYATIDWRFHKNWSLETTFGNLGSSFADIVWQHRY
jgi:translocation and assembly module TamB